MNSNRKCLTTEIAAVRWTGLVKMACFSALFVIFVNHSLGQVRPLLNSMDSAIAIDLDGLLPVASSYPGGENPTLAIDGDPLSGDPPAPTRTKYLNFGGAGSGLIVTPLLGLPVESFQIRAANDAPGRDPASWELYGFDGTLVSTDNSDGLGESWTLIDSGDIPLNMDAAMDPRFELFPAVDVMSGGTGYENYKMVFPTLRDPGSTLFQIGEIQFYDSDDATGFGILTPGDPILAITDRVAPNSSYPGAESPATGIDQNSATKYLNFGEENSGIIITNSTGPIKVESMALTTANDAPARDPASYELYGTNDPIQSTDNSDGNGGESYTLISSGMLSLPGDPTIGDDGRFMEVLVPINATDSYTSYKLVFPTVKDVELANSMQIADIQFNGVPEPSALLLAVWSGLVAVAALRRRRR